MSSLTFALTLVTLELMLIGILALLFGDRLRERLFRRRNNQKAFAKLAEDKNVDLARNLVALHARLALAIEPISTTTFMKRANGSSTKASPKVAPVAGEKIRISPTTARTATDSAVTMPVARSPANAPIRISTRALIARTISGSAVRKSGSVMATPLRACRQRTAPPGSWRRAGPPRRRSHP